MTLIEIPTRFIDKARFVRAIFTDVENEYDGLVHLMTLSFDWVWRRRMFAKMGHARAGIILDLACGTGLVTFELTRMVGPSGFVVGLDLSPAMLTVAKRKRHVLGGDCTVDFVRAAGEFLPFRSSSFGYVTVGLALRNFGDKVAVFRESLRALNPLGWFLSVDFVIPGNGFVWRLYRFHIFHIIPAIGGLVSAHWKYTLVYLANSILKSASGEENCRLLSEAGFDHTVNEGITLGVVALIGGKK